MYEDESVGVKLESASVEKLMDVYQQVCNKRPATKYENLGIGVVNHLVVSRSQMRIGTDLGPMDIVVPDFLMVDEETFKAEVPKLVDTIVDTLGVTTIRHDIHAALVKQAGVVLHHNGLCFIANALVEGLGEVDNPTV